MTVSVPKEAITDGPDMQWNHIDGPLMFWAGHMHWLTWPERIALFFKRTTVDEIGCRRFPHLARLRSSLRAPGIPS